MLFAGWEVRILKNRDGGPENAVRGRRPSAAFSSPKPQHLTIRTDPKAVNNFFNLSSSSQTKKTYGKKKSRKRYCDRGQR